ncbi:MAG: ABC transporter ATP-binding protein [Anaerolineaceae bacterium]|nr:ABC transporter ATP-binding protein [Anaerolineaceae bacterium]
MPKMTDPYMIDMQHVSHTFNGNGQPPRHALQGINLSVSNGEFIALIGPSGCGKSTVLRILANLIQPQTGSVQIDGISPKEFTAQRRLGWMAQQPALLPWLTVKQNVALAHRFHPLQAAPQMSPDEALEIVGLIDAADAYPESLSGGMQQRLSLARLLSLDVDLWLMDEPFAALDELTRSALAQELSLRWQPLHPTVLWITHNIQEAVLLADRILILSPSPGNLIADIPVDFSHPRDPDQPEFYALVSKLRQQLVGKIQYT